MRTGRATTVALLVLAVTACRAVLPMPSAPSESNALPSDPTPAQTPTPEPEVSCVDVLEPESLGDLIPGTLAQVVTDELVMRTAPRISADSEILPTTLNEPDVIYVEHGPVEADGYAWYLVLVGGAGSGRGWIADASRDGEPWVRSLGAEGSWCILGTAAFPGEPNLHLATAGPDDRIYVFGVQGLPATETGSSGRSWAYDPATDAWQELEPAPATALGIVDVASADDGRFWVFIATTDVVDPAATWGVDIYDPANSRWGRAEPVPLALLGRKSWTGDGRLLAVSIDRITVYDLSSESVEAHPISGSVDFMTVGGDDYLLMVEGGIGPLDVDTMTVGALNHPRFARYSPSASVTGDGSIALVGGRRLQSDDPRIELGVADASGETIRLVETFDPISTTWTTLAPLPPGLESATAVASGDELYVVMDTPFGVTVARYVPPDE
jgi:hypothetical protein